MVEGLSFSIWGGEGMYITMVIISVIFVIHHYLLAHIVIFVHLVLSS